MELIESLEDINKRLKDEFGYGPDGLNPEWRVVFAGDQTETRIMDRTDEGFELLYPEPRLVRKFQHIKPDRYVLERQVRVTGETDIYADFSYEPAWTFEDRHGEYLPPRWFACKVLIDNIYMQADKAGLYKKYNDPETDPEFRNKQLQEMEKMLFGEETPVGDALAHGDGISMAGLDGRTKSNE